VRDASCASGLSLLLLGSVTDLKGAQGSSRRGGIGREHNGTLARCSGGRGSARRIVDARLVFASLSGIGVGERGGSTWLARRPG
jgi:hypothetical protein